MIIDVEKIYNEEKQKLQKSIDLNKIKKVVMIKASNDEASEKYIKNKEKLLNEFNIPYFLHKLKEDITQEELNIMIEKYSMQEDIGGIMLELPIYNHLDSSKALEKIDFKKDIDGLTKINQAKLFVNEKGIIPCTAKAVIRVLESLNINLEGKNVVLLGRSNLVGKPLLPLLLNKNATPTICHSKTKNLKEITKRADILICAIGKKHFIDESYTKEDAIIIDVGTNYHENKLYGDVNLERVNNTKNLITPVPNGIGLLTKLMFIENIIELASEKINKKFRIKM